MERLHAIVPAAGSVRNGADVRLNLSPLFRIARGRVFFHLILEELRRSGLHFESVRVGVRSEDLFHARYLASPFQDLPISFFACDSSQSPLETVLRLSEGIEEGDSVLLVLGDTSAEIPSEPIRSGTPGFLVNLEESYQGRLENVFLRSQEGTSFAYAASQSQSSWFSTRASHVGVYWYPHVQENLGTLNTILDLVFRSSGRGVRAFEARNWIDADRSDLLEALQFQNFESRSFNSVSVNKYKSTVTKISQNRTKLYSEYSYLEKLPNELKSLFPRVLSFENGDQSARMDMDYWPLNNLGDLYVFEELSQNFWDTLMLRLREHLNLIHSYSSSSTGDFAWVHEVKVNERLAILASHPEWDLPLDQPITINGILIESPLSLVRKAQGLLLIYGDARESVVHGDFCFSNILVNTEALTLKFLDPRGGFQLQGVTGPSAYDEAKLAHSLTGDYDLILKGFFELHQESGKTDADLTLEVNRPRNFARALSSYEKYMLLGSQHELIEISSGLILCSIPPLHMEDIRRAKAFFARGLTQIYHAMKSIKPADLGVT